MNGSIDISFNLFGTLILIFIVIAIMLVVNSLLNINKSHAFKSKLYDEKIKLEEQETIISGLEIESKRYESQLKTSFKNNTRLNEINLMLKTKVSQLNIMRLKLEDKCKLLDRSYKSLLRRTRTLELELANANQHVKNINATDSRKPQLTSKRTA